MARTSDDYRPCVALWPSGEERKANVYYIRLMAPSEAVDALGSGRIAFVAPEDAGSVKDMVGKIKGTL